MGTISMVISAAPAIGPTMSGAILQPPIRPDADWGVVFIEVSGYLAMCGHGAMGVATVLVETGMVEVTEPITTDTGVDPARGRLLAAGLVGLSQVSARYWLAQEAAVPISEAVELVYTLAWRGISRFPRTR